LVSNSAPGFQHCANVLERKRLLKRVVINKNVGARHHIEAVLRGQIRALENDVEVHRFTGQYRVGTDAHRSRFQALSAVDGLKDLRRPDRRHRGSHPIAQRTPVGDQLRRPRTRDVARQLEDVTGALPGAFAEALDMVGHSGADVEDRHRDGVVVRQPEKPGPITATPGCLPFPQYAPGDREADPRNLLPART
jgi:hypothetical protein